METQARYGDLAGTQLVSTSEYAYDGRGLLTGLTHEGPTNNVIADYVYVYDLAGRVTSETLNGNATPYGYDATNQLTSDGANTYSYDANGNRTMAGYVTGPANRLMNDGVWSYTYDVDGNLIKKSKGANDETWTYEYDHRNQLTTAARHPTDGGPIEFSLTIFHDAFGNRIEDQCLDLGGTPELVRHAVDNRNTWSDLDDDNQLTTRRLYLDSVDSVFASLDAQGVAAWYLLDRLGSIVQLVDDTGLVRDPLQYDGFGELIAETDPGFGDRYHFTGREWSSDLGLQYHRARHYDPGIGRWTALDPSGYEPGDANYYRYVTNSPGQYVDWNGLQQVRPVLDMDIPHDPLTGAQGAFVWPVTWTIQNAGREGGVIIQDLTVMWSIRTYLADGNLNPKDTGDHTLIGWRKQRVPGTKYTWYSR